VTRARALGTLEALDAAIELVRSEPPARLLWSLCPGLALTWLCLFLYYLERVEGVRSLRPWFALALALLWCVRGVLLGRLAGRCVERLLGAEDAAPLHGPASSLLAGAIFTGAELWLWLWLLILAVQLDPWLALAVLPLFSLRGALWPSWLAVCDAQREPNPGAVALAALCAGGGQRLLGVAAELLLLFGSVGLFFNLGALLAAFISLSQDLLGLDLSFVRAFISPSNHFALLGVAGLALSAFEPLRAALSGVLFAEQRRAREGIGVRALVQRCLAQAGARTAKLALLLCLLAPAHAGAQPVGGGEREAGDAPQLAGDALAHAPLSDEECDEICNDARTRDDLLLVELVSILDGHEFREFPEPGFRGEELGQEALTRWFERFWRWLQGGEPQQHAAPAAHRLPAAPSARVALPLGLSLLAASLLLWLASARRRTRPEAAGPASAPQTELLAPERYLDEALAARGEPRRALRALYLASLSGLSRRGLLTLSHELTNGHYLAKLPAGPERASFAELTGLFDRTCYGALLPSGEELARAGQLAAALVHGREGA
jgi:hypothetical protein